MSEWKLMMALEIRNPATGEIAGSVRPAEAQDFDSAVANGREIQPIWAARRFAERAAVIRRFHDSILDNCDRILDVIQSETGKARRDAFAEVVSVAGTGRYYLAHGAEPLALRHRDAAFPLITDAEVIYKPHGVVGLITLWNYPFLLGIADAIPALLAGNAVIVKPSELTPLSADLARELFIESGLDPNLLYVFHGGADVSTAVIR